MITNEIFEKYESEVRFYCRSFPVVFTTANGSLMYDSSGREYIDFFCGAGALNYGHNNSFIKKKIMDYLAKDGIIHAMDMMTVAKGEFIQTVQDKLFKSRGMDYKIMFTGPTGTNAVEAALKLARKVKGRNDIWTLMGAFHGMTLGSLALTTENAARRAGGVSLENVKHIPAPYMMDGFDTIRYMQMLLDDDHSGAEKPAGIIIETVQAEGGIHVFSIEWMKMLEEFCHKNDILLIVDDIQVGCARTGRFFSFERAHILPDVFVMSKSIGGYGFPFALTFLRPELDVFKPGEHNGTFRGNQLAMVAATAGINYCLEDDIENEVEYKAGIIKNYLEDKIENKEYLIRGIGCIWGVDVKRGSLSKKIISRCFEKGVVIECAGRNDSVVKLMPALNMPEDIMMKGLEVIVNAINNS